MQDSVRAGPRGTSNRLLYDNAGMKSLTTEEIKQAIYLDFESEGKKRTGEEPPPTLGGAMIENEYTPTLLHSDLASAAEARGWGHASLADHLKPIHERAVTEGRRIVFFSSTESNLFKTHGMDIEESGFDLGESARESELYKHAFEAYEDNDRRFRDPDTAQATRDELRPVAYDLLTLIAAELGMERPDSYGAGKTGARIRYALKQAGKKTDYESWSPGGKTRLTQAVDHNQHDCKAARFVLEHLAANS